MVGVSTHPKTKTPSSAMRGGDTIIEYPGHPGEETQLDPIEGREAVDVRPLAEWKRLVQEVKNGIGYLRNRLTGNCEAPYDCSQMFQVYHPLVQAFDPSFAAQYVDRTANGVTTPSKRPSLRYRRRPWGARSQWAARPCRGSGLLAAPFGLVHGDQRHLCLDAKAPVMREGPGSVARYFYRRVRLLGRSLAFGFGLLGWRCARSAQRGVPCSHEGASGLMVSDGAGRVGRPRVSHSAQTFPWLGQGCGGLSCGEGLVGMSALDSDGEAQVLWGGGGQEVRKQVPMAAQARPPASISPLARAPLAGGNRAPFSARSITRPSPLKIILHFCSATPTPRNPTDLLHWHAGSNLAAEDLPGAR